MRKGKGLQVLHALAWRTDNRKSRDVYRMLAGVFRNEHKLATIAAALEDDFVSPGGEVAGLDEEGNVADFQSFMQWVLDNQDQIIAFIKKIIEMFENMET